MRYQTMFKRNLVVVFAAFWFLWGGALAGKAAPIESTAPRITDSFQQMMDLSVGTLLTPTVVDLVFAPEISNGSISQSDNEAIIVSKFKNTPESSVSNVVTLPAREFSPVFVASAPEVGMHEASGVAMYDKNLTTYVEFPLPETRIGGTAIITMTSATPEALNGFTFSLDNNVALPTRVGVVASVEGADKTVLSPVAAFGQRVSFPRTVAKEWKITFWYDQPLRISELSFFAETGNLYERHVKFLAQPGEEYRLYARPDHQFSAPLASVAYNLSSVTPAISLSVGSMSSNPYYRPTDTDSDGVSDQQDNCPRLANPKQEDVNKNAVGDVCEDFDKDGLMNNADNCLNLPNADQRDTDGDGIGDKCDTEESRFTERHAWVPWVGMGTAVVVLIALFALTARKGIKEHPGDSL